MVREPCSSFSGFFGQALFSPIFASGFQSSAKECKGVHCEDLGESFPTSIYLQKSASIQPRTSPSEFGGEFNSIFIRLLTADVIILWVFVGAVERSHRSVSCRPAPRLFSMNGTDGWEGTFQPTYLTSGQGSFANVGRHVLKHWQEIHHLIILIGNEKSVPTSKFNKLP